MNKRIAISFAIALSLVQGCATHQRSSANTEEKFDAGNIVMTYLQQFEKDPRNMPILSDKLQKHFRKFLKTKDQDEFYNVSHIKKFGNVALVRADMKTVEYGRKTGWVAFQVDDKKIEGIAASFKLPDGFRYKAEAGQAADVASTAAGLAAGLAEANPIMDGVISTGGIPALAAVKLGATALVKRSGISNCSSNLGGLGGVGAGAAAWNVALIAGLGPFGIIPALGAGYLLWDDRDEAFWDCMPQEVVDYVQKVENEIR